MTEIRRFETTSALPDNLTNRLELFFFTSKGFSELWRSLGGRPVYWAAEETGEVVAVLPGVEFGRKPLVRFQSMPDGCYSRMVFSDNGRSRESEIIKAILDAVYSHGYAKCFVTDFEGNFPAGNRCELISSTTLLVDISEADWMPPDKKIQSEIRKAQRETTAIERFDAREHMALFLELMRQTEKRHSRAPKYDEKFFTALAELAAKDDRIIWYFVRHEGRAATSHINFVLDNSVLNWQVYFDKEFSFLKANQLLLVRLASEVRERGMVSLNMGQSPIEAESLQSYKKKWGGVEHEYRTLSACRGIGRLL
ncbi:MAG TPA: GNAT family N-acetyltransferase [candidate division Zixibacteria bacterium]|nr:GNAT family N-acetyltransferase [candidate division Zixibacteria bacterium]